MDREKKGNRLNHYGNNYGFPSLSLYLFHCTLPLNRNLNKSPPLDQNTTRNDLLRTSPRIP